MKKILCMIITILLSTACTSNNQNPSTEEKTGYFEKNKDCYSYIENLRKDFENENTAIESIFYSPKLDTCLYLEVTVINLWPHSELRDVFTNELILESDQAVVEFQDEIKKLGYK